jgi:uncharacterized protein
MTALQRRQQTVDTPVGPARITWHDPAGDVKACAVLALGHGAGGGIEARDLAALAEALPGYGVGVALVEQPWRVAGRKLAPAPARLDQAWTALWPELAGRGLPVIAGGRSAGARVACRTAAALGAAAVLTLSFPLHPQSSLLGELSGAADALPLLTAQGGNDPFGRPEEFPRQYAPGVVVPGGDHGFAVPKRGPLTQREALELLVTGVHAWLADLGHAAGR